MLAEVANTLVISYVGTECALRGPSGISVRPLIVVALLNLASWTSLHVHAAHGIDAWLLDHKWAELALLVACLLTLIAASCAVPNLQVLSRSSWSKLLLWGKGRLPDNWIAAMLFIAALLSGCMMVPLGGIWLLAHMQQAMLPPVCRRVLLATVAYPLACYADLLRCNPHLSPRNFATLVPRALVDTAALFFPIFMFISAVFLGLVSALEHAGMDSHVLNWPVYYGIIYGPFATFYFSVKRQFLHKGFHTMLPV